MYLYSVPKVKSKHYLENSKSYYQKNVLSYFGEFAQIPWAIYRLQFTSKDIYTYIYNDSITSRQLSNSKIISQSRVLEDYSTTSAITGISPQAKFIFGTYNPGDNNFVYYAKNLETNQLYILKNYKTHAGNYSQTLTVSDNGFGVLNYNNSYCEYLYDFKADAPFKSICGDEHLSSYVKIASNGKYYMRNNFSNIKVLKPEASTVLKTIHNLNTWSINVKYWEFNPVNSNQFVISDNKVIDIYQCEPAILTKKIELDTNEELMNIDFFNNEYLTYKPGKITVKSFPESDVLFELDVNVKYDYILHNRMIIFKNGDYYMYRIK